MMHVLGYPLIPHKPHSTVGKGQKPSSVIEGGLIYLFFANKKTWFLNHVLIKKHTYYLPFATATSAAKASAAARESTTT